MGTEKLNRQVFIIITLKAFESVFFNLIFIPLVTHIFKKIKERPFFGVLIVKLNSYVQCCFVSTLQIDK